MHLRFKSKPEAYTYAIAVLSDLKRSHNNEKMDDCINQIKIAVENHEQNPHVVSQCLTTLMKDTISDVNERLALGKLANAIEISPYDKQSSRQRFENIVGRRFESEIGIRLLQSPTKAMMAAVKRVSDEVVKAIENVEKTGDHSDKMVAVCNGLKERCTFTSFAAFKHRPELKTVKAILMKNESRQLAEIMNIHFMFGGYAVREMPIVTAPQRMPSGHLLHLIKSIDDQCAKNPVDYFKTAIAIPGLRGKDYRKYIIDIVMYNSEYFQAEESKRGRGEVDHIESSQMGLMLSSQAEEMKGLPKHASRWMPDCIAQRPLLSSRIVRDCIDNDTIYVSGPSGMTCVLLGQMETLANLESVQLKQHYLAAVAAFIMGGGYHSLHEVLAPAEFSLKLIPGYKVTVADTKMDSKSAPPNYAAFFELQRRIDPEFSSRREIAWNNYMNYFINSYVPRNNLPTPVCTGLKAVSSHPNRFQYAVVAPTQEVKLDVHDPKPCVFM